LACLVLVGTIVHLILIFKNNTVSDMSSNTNGQDHIEDIIKTERTSLNFPVSSRNSMQTLIDHNPGMAFSAEFSALKNLCRIFTIEKKKNGENYAFLNGVRVLALFWVIIGHSFLFNIMYTSNALDAITWTRNIVLQFIYNAEFSVDTFFVLSGLLTTVLFVRQVEKDKKLSPRLMFLYYIHRYIRLTPTFLLIVAISINLTPYFGSGPLYPTQQGFETPQCRTKYWWTSILYVGNIVKPDYVCVPVSWYLHNDMQFHWIAPLTLIPFVLGRKPLAFVVSTVLVLVGIGSIAGLLIYYPDLQATNSITAPQTVISSIIIDYKNS
jgi:peptidoglycan/LPS O-acetylase OafA/YrhL